MISVLLLLLWDKMFSRLRAEAKTNLFVNNEHYDQAKLLVIFLLLCFGVLFSTINEEKTLVMTITLHVLKDRERRRDQKVLETITGSLQAG